MTRTDGTTPDDELHKLVLQEKQLFSLPVQVSAGRHPLAVIIVSPSFCVSLMQAKLACGHVVAFSWVLSVGSTHVFVYSKPSKGAFIFTLSRLVPKQE